jgi:hypothetical protein
MRASEVDYVVIIEELIVPWNLPIRIVEIVKMKTAES